MVTWLGITCKPVQSTIHSMYANEFSMKLCISHYSNSGDEQKSKAATCDLINLPPEPQNCCMSGCANCVWVAYAEEVAKLVKDGELAKQKIYENVKDPNLRAFLMLELKHIFQKNS